MPFLPLYVSPLNHTRRAVRWITLFGIALTFNYMRSLQIDLHVEHTSCTVHDLELTIHIHGLQLIL